MKVRVIILFIELCVLLLGVDSQRKDSVKSKSDGADGRKGRQKARATVISCRVFRKGVCKKTSKNIILVNKSIANSAKCQQFCFATKGCAAFTFFEQTKVENKKCVLFRDCNGKLSDCRRCISGPIMPRITECLAARQVLLPEEGKHTCTGSCTGFCVGPNCPDLLGENSNSSNLIEDEKLEDARFDYESLTGDFSNKEYEDYLENYETEDYYDNENYDYAGDYAEEESVQIGNTLDEEAANEDENEIEENDFGIDDGFLNDSEGKTVQIPKAEQRSDISVSPSKGGGNTYIFHFCMVGGTNKGGTVTSVDLLNPGLGNLINPLVIPSLPTEALQGDTSSAYTNGVITTCSQGYTILSPYGFIYKPGNCYDLNLQANQWQPTGARLTRYRKGATITKLGRYLMASGGYKKKRPVRTVEMLDTKKPKTGWKKMEKLTLPVPVSEHCTVTLKGQNGKEVIVTGGKGREQRVLKLDIRTKKWYSMNRLTEGRRRHACVKADLNGRPGLVVSGGSNRAGSNVTSVEFYDAKTGVWYSLPPMRRGRQSHAMTVTNGKIMVAGGERIGRRGKEYLDDVEVFNGKRWVRTNHKLDKPRSKFSLIKIPKNRTKKNKMKYKKKKRNGTPK